jgi:hypothetical protein
MIGLLGVCMVGDWVQVLALPCSTPLGCEGSTPLLIGLGMGHPGDGRRTGSLCPCGATAWDALVYKKSWMKRPN